MHSTPEQLYNVDIFLALRELFSENRCAEQFDDETLAELLYRERLVERRVEAHEAEIAREALLNDEREFLA
jgi:hypothetical protein